MVIPSPYSLPCQHLHSPLLCKPSSLITARRGNHNKFLHQGKRFTVSVRSSLYTPKHVAPTPLYCPDEIPSWNDKSETSLFVNYDDSPINEEEQERMGFDKRSSTASKVQALLDGIGAFASEEGDDILNIILKNCRIRTLLDFNDLLMGLVSSNQLDLALKLHSNLEKYQVVPDCQTQSLLIRCYCKKNGLDEALRVLEDMVKTGFHPDAATFTVLITSLSKRGRLQKAFEVLELMNQSGHKPTVQTFNSLLKGLCYVGRVEEACERLTEIKKASFKPDIYTYAAVMDGFCKVGRSNEAMELLNEALEMGLTPTVVTYNTLFHGYCKEGRPMDGIGVLRQMEQKNCKPDYITYNTLLHGLLKWDKILTALRVYKEMVGIGFEVDERIMRALLRGLCRKSLKEKDLSKDAYQVFEKMTSRALGIDYSTYDLLIQAVCLRKESDKAFVVLQHMIGLGYIPRIITFNNVIRVLCLHGKLNKALLVLVLIYEDNCRIPSRITYDLLLRELDIQGQSLGACSVYGAALKQGMVLDRKPQRRGNYLEHQ
ncbi:pentatricopeptide repeat-containing protein [Tripterygium wilfordii]|uniref:Pentatricopeptide repeat-containing protein n=1 Tax=Tripterygium wilfordii TaxID=458696 RepID=A0A7J7DNK5_TRIWF|nr:pentatricopeptide repeat-containing protein At1g12775, mitochondrial-like [Tripterygium wilfordii]KAF5747676.1 pentatricopeptide repeat-containing protein [Tripterygium wilfordii]